MNRNRDEIRRQLRASETANSEALPRFARALRRAFDPEGGADRHDRAALVGLPSSRRGFLRVGGLTVAASAVLVACGGEAGDPGVSRTGSVPEGTASGPPELEPSSELDTTLLLTAGSIEVLAVATYEELLEQGWIEDEGLNEVAQVFRDQHREHEERIAEAAREVGATPYEEANPHLWSTVVEPDLATIESAEEEERQSLALDLAYRIEDIATQSYTRSAGLLTTADLREAAISIGSVEARHVSVIFGALGEPQVPFPLVRTSEAISESGFVS